MKKPNFTKFVRDTKRSLVKHSPGILTGIGVSGMVVTTVLAVSATPKALKLIEQKKREEHKEKLTPVEVVKTCWKPYVPAAITGVTSMTCIFSACSINARRNAAIATAYKLSETALIEYRDKVVQTVGEKKEQLIRDEIAKDHITANPVSQNNIIVTGKGSSRCYDVISGRYFESDIDRIKRAENELNKKLLHEDYVSLNEFYDELGLEHIYPIGDDIGWNIDGGMVDINFSSHIAEDGQPCIVVNYSIAPRYDYSHYR